MSKKLNHRLPVLGQSYRPPPTRGDCISGSNPITGTLDERTAGKRGCSAFECRHNLLVMRSSEMPGRKHNGLSPEWSLSGDAPANAPSCALDVADHGPKSCAEIARLMGLTTRRVEQILKEALGKQGGVELYKLRGELMGNMEEE